MFGPKIKLEKGLYERAKKCAELAGYSSVDEFIVHLIEKELAQLEGAESDAVSIGWAIGPRDGADYAGLIGASLDRLGIEPAGTIERRQQ